MRAHLDRLGYPFVMTSKPIANHNGLLVACRWPIEHAPDDYTLGADQERWLALRLNELDLDILAVHIPGAPDNKFENGYGISGAKRKELFWEYTINYAVSHKDRQAIILGDFNTGFRIDAEGTNFKQSHWMAKLLEIGYIDTWRHLHTHERDYTWFSKRVDKTTGKSEDLNGFRLDYIFVSPALQHAVTDAAILHGPRTAGASDHASVVLKLRTPEVGATTVIAKEQLSTETMTGEQSFHTLSDKLFHPRGHKAAMLVQGRKLSARFEIVGGLPDMKCGLNGQEFLQQFRPTYVTAEWAEGVLKEVRIWGPRVLQDGSLGKRELDHQWKTPVPDGGVRYSDLPPSVAAQLKAHVSDNGFAGPPQ
ncbi:hypothetical protein MINTM006_22880 [Mycobacterium intracellulare]|nr:hypothetical protein MINTM006_22880 [Mycobacterium intracellulare]BCP20604.1 hypothetical protein MINTM023_23930 [Mycobacterium intracellulare]BCP31581.1 hypothetical protein MINTM026_25510 [Mycobacterium intracellulare]